LKVLHVGVFMVVRKADSSNLDDYVGVGDDDSAEMTVAVRDCEVERRRGFLGTKMTGAWPIGSAWQRFWVFMTDR
jgi:hypothetical protein